MMGNPMVMNHNHGALNRRNHVITSANTIFPTNQLSYASVLLDTPLYFVLPTPSLLRCWISVIGHRPRDVIVTLQVIGALFTEVCDNHIASHRVVSCRVVYDLMHFSICVYSRVCVYRTQSFPTGDYSRWFSIEYVVYDVRSAGLLQTVGRPSELLWGQQRPCFHIEQPSAYRRSAQLSKTETSWWIGTYVNFKWISLSGFNM